MERFVMRNYGPSRNLPDGHGSYIFMERGAVRGISDPAMAKLFDSYPDVHVQERGHNIVGPPLPQGPPPPQEKEDVVEKPSYDALSKRDLRDMAKLRKIDVAGLNRDDLIVALNAADGLEQEEAESAAQEPIDYSTLSYKDLQEIAKEREIRFTGIKKDDLIAALQTWDAQQQIGTQ